MDALRTFWQPGIEFRVCVCLGVCVCVCVGVCVVLCVCVFVGCDLGNLASAFTRDVLVHTFKTFHSPGMHHHASTEQFCQAQKLPCVYFIGDEDAIYLYTCRCLSCICLLSCGYSCSSMASGEAYVVDKSCAVGL